MLIGGLSSSGDIDDVIRRISGNLKNAKWNLEQAKNRKKGTHSRHSYRHPHYPTKVKKIAFQVESTPEDAVCANIYKKLNSDDRH